MLYARVDKTLAGVAIFLSDPAHPIETTLRTGFTALMRGRLFDRGCRRHEIEHRFTKPKHPWTNGQVERMNRTIKDATVRHYQYPTHAALQEHLATLLDA